MRRIQSLRDRLPDLGPAGFHTLRATAAKAVGKGRITRRTSFDYPMWLPLDDPGVSRELIRYGRRELDVRLMLQHVLKPGMNVVDVGANIGYYTIMIARAVGASGRVVAIEPLPANVSVLHENVKLNRLANVSVIEGAVSASEGYADFYLSSASNLGSLRASKVALSRHTGEKIRVATIPIATLLDTSEPVDLVRMDIEGHEVDVLDALALLPKDRLPDQIIFECHARLYSAQHHVAEPVDKLLSEHYAVGFLSSATREASRLIEESGYAPLASLRTDGTRRNIYRGVARSDVIDFLCTGTAVRTISLMRSRPSRGERSSTPK